MENQEEITIKTLTFQIIENDNSLIINIKQSLRKGLLALGMSVVCGGVAYLSFIIIPNYIFAIQILVAILMFYLFYMSLVYIFNTTTITISDDKVKLRHAPLPWGTIEIFKHHIKLLGRTFPFNTYTWTGNVDILKKDIRQVFIKTTLADRGYQKANRYKLTILNQTDKSYTLYELNKLEEGIFLKQKIENFLKIEDDSNG